MTNLTLIPSTSPKNSTPAPCEARAFFKEFKKEAQKLIQTQPCLILVVDPGPAEEPTSSSTVVGSCNGGGQSQNLQSDSTTTTSSSSPDAAQDQQQQQVIIQAVQKQIVRCAEVDRCCEAVRNVLKKLSPCVPQDFEWREKVTRLPVILVNTSAGVGKFRRATRLYNGSSAFVIISEDFVNGRFFEMDLDRVCENIKVNQMEPVTISHQDQQLTVPTKATSVLTICQRQLEQKVTQFLMNYQADDCPLKKALLGHPRPENDRDEHVGTHSCAFVQETYQEQLHNEDTCTFVIYHASSCPACPCALRCTDFIVSFLQQEASRTCTEHRTKNNLEDDADFQQIAAEARNEYPVRSGVVDFCPCGMKKTEKWPILVCGALNIEENEIDHSLFPELTIPHFRFFPCGKNKASRLSVIERTVRAPTYLFDKVRAHYLSAAAQYSEGLATNENFVTLVTAVFERAKQAVEAKLAQLCPQVKAALEDKTKDDFISAGVQPDAAVVDGNSSNSQNQQDSNNNNDHQSQEQQHKITEGIIEGVGQDQALELNEAVDSPTTLQEKQFLNRANEMMMQDNNNNNNNNSNSNNNTMMSNNSSSRNFNDDRRSSNNSTPSSSINNNNNTDAAETNNTLFGKGTTVVDRTAKQSVQNANPQDDMTIGRRAINPLETNPRTGDFDAGNRRAREDSS